MTENKAYLNTQKQLLINQLIQPFIGSEFQYGTCDCHIIFTYITDTIRGTQYREQILNKYNDVESATEYHLNGELKLSTVLRKDFQRVHELEPMDCIVYPAINAPAHITWYLGSGLCLTASAHSNTVHIINTPDLKGARLYRFKNKE